MTQPELGQKLADIRKQKGLTQEEVVARCNVTVRTIQRIESGEVTPRTSTLRLIIEALEYDWQVFTQSPKTDEVISEGGHATSSTWINQIFFIRNAMGGDWQSANLAAQFAWVSGLIYFILGVPESLFEIRVVSGESFSTTAYIAIKIGTIVSFFFFMRGFILLAQREEKTLLCLASILYMVVLLVDYSWDIYRSPDFNQDERLVVKGMMYGLTSATFGLALFRIESVLGRSANFAGILELLAGGAFLSVILFFVGIILLGPAELVEIYLLFKYAERIKRESPKTQIA